MKKTNDSRIVRKAPHFICIGPEKTGTTLLYSLLQDHPAVALPPMKEIRYWDEGYNIPAHSISMLVSSDHWHYTFLRKKLLRKTKAEIGRLGLARWAEDTDYYWWLRYILGRRCHNWYEALFNADKFSGDVSPRYYHLPEARVREISQYNPNLKVVMCVRDPLERAWSRLAMVQLNHKNRRLEDLHFDEFKKHAENLLSSWIPYLETAALWRKYFDDVHMAFYDDLLKDQFAWFTDISHFLGLEICKTDDSHDRRVNVGITSGIPNDFVDVLREQYSQEILELQARYPNLDWRSKYSL